MTEEDLDLPPPPDPLPQAAPAPLPSPSAPPGPSDEESRQVADDERFEPDELRVDEQSKEEVLGASYERQTFEGVTTYDAAMFGNSNKQFNFSAPKPRISSRRPPGIDDIAHCYEPTGQEDELRKRLDQRRTVCLTGEPGTGRLTSACRALLDRFRTDQVRELLPPPGRDVKEAVHEITGLTPGRGYLIRIYDEDPAPIISRLHAIIEAAKCELILIRDSPGRMTATGDAEIRHARPSARGVFKAHLHRLRHTAKGPPTAYEHMVGEGGVALPSRPRDVVALAMLAVDHPPDGAKEELNKQNQLRLQETAAGILDVRRPVPTPARRRLPQHRRAFRLAFALLDGEPISRVFDATGMLLSCLDKESGWDDLGRTALEHSVVGLLGDDLAAHWRSDDERPLARVERGLPKAMLHVVWHEFDHTRPALVSWLNLLVEADQEVFRNAAVRAAVTLSLVDFDEVFRMLVDPWSGSAKPRVQRSAARAIVILSSAKQVNQRVYRTVDSWVWGAANRRRETAAWAYASGLQQGDPRWSLLHLGRIAQDPMQRGRLTVAEGIGQLATPALYGLIVSTLADWIRQDAPARLATRHAARSLLRIAQIPGAEHWSSTPALLCSLAEGEVSSRDLSVLWYAALLGASTQCKAWPVLLSWLEHAHSNADLRKPVAEMLDDMAGAPPLRRRMRQCLLRPDAPSWISAVIKEWER
jgi:hypothetical protein